MPAVAAALPGALVSVGVGLAVNAVVGYVTSAIAGPATTDRSAPLTTGIRLEPRVGVDVPVSAVFGWTATPGTYWYQNSFGDDNEYLQLVYVIGRGEHHSLTDVLGDNVASTMSGSNASPKGRVLDRWTKDGVAHAWVKFYSGAVGQAADPELVARAKPAGRWPATKTMTATAYVIVTLRYDDKVFPNGIPAWRFVLKGLKVYDRRKDSTQPGGSGAHRWGQPATYEWSENPAVLQDNWRRGIWWNDVRLLGLGVAESACHHARIVAAANLCDEAIHYDDTGMTRPRYSFGGEITDEADEAAVLRMFETAMAGYGAEYGGAYAPVPAQTMLPVLTLKDTHRVQNGAVDERRRLDPSIVKTAYNGMYLSPADGWLTREYGLRFDAAIESAEGGRRQGKLDLEFVPYLETASAIAEIFRRRDRFAANETADYGITAAPLEAGDVVTRESETFGTIQMMVWAKKEIGPETYRLTLRQWDNSIVPTPSAGFVPLPVDMIPAPIPDRPITVVGFMLVAASLPSGPNSLPVLRATWTPITDRTVDRVIIKYWLSADPSQVRYQSVDDVASGIAVIEGVLPETAYQAEATIVTTPARPTIWSTLGAATTGRLIVGDLAIDSVDLSALRGEVRGMVADLHATTRALIEQAQELATLGAGEALANYSEHAQLRRELQLVKEDVTARYTEAITIAVNSGGALASRLELLEVAVNETQASAIDLLETRVDGHDAYALAITKLNAGTTPGDIGSATLSMISSAGVGGMRQVAFQVENAGAHPASLILRASNAPGTPTEIVMDAQRFILGDFSSGSEINPLVYLGGVWRMNVAHIGTVTAGILQGPGGASYFNLNTGALRAST